MKQLSRWMILLTLVVLMAAFAPPEQVANSPITIAVDAGFDGSFRENAWIPLYIHVENDGPAVEGRLLVRPQTSDNAVNNTYSLPISLPEGSRKAVFLYITARSFASQIRLELLDNEGVVIAAEPVALRSVQPRDQLHIVVTQSPSGSVDLTGVHDGGYVAFQANWQIENIPDRATALNAVDTLLFSAVDTGTLSSTQREAIITWVAQGGHLIVTGGANWQSTASGLMEILPFTPEDTATVDGLETIAEWMRQPGNELSQQTVITTGSLSDGAYSLIETAGQPLLARRTMGLGTIDYLAVDPNALPLRGWGGLTDLWMTLATTVDPQPSWTTGVTAWDTATASVNVLPGVDLLPDILPLCGFLALYIALIGPANYYLLNRLNRREYAWLTIPVLIVAFSAMSWVVGFNLRGNEVTISRLTVVESWPDTDQAQVQQLLGVLSPRRAQYTLSVPEADFLRPTPRVTQGQFLGGNIQASMDIQQAEMFQAYQFPIDASYIAAFHASAAIAKPEVGGQARMFYDAGTRQQVIRGSVRNDSPETLTSPTILVRGQAHILDGTLEPGAVKSFEITLPGEGLPSPAPLAYAPGAYVSVYYRSYSYQNTIPQTLRDILGTQLEDPRRLYGLQPVGDSVEEQEVYRRRLFLASFINEPFNVLTGRGNKAYLAAWSDKAPMSVELEGANWKTLDTTLYLAQLEVEIEQPTGVVRVSPDQFTWYVQTRNTLTDAAPVDLSLQPGDEAVFRYTPLPSAVLREVDELDVVVDRASSSNRNVPLQLWNWETDEWEEVFFAGENIETIRNPVRYLGPQNSVQIRVIADAAGGYPRLQDLTIEQRGRF